MFSPKPETNTVQKGADAVVKPIAEQLTDEGRVTAKTDDMEPMDEGAPPIDRVDLPATPVQHKAGDDDEVVTTTPSSKKAEIPNCTPSPETKQLEKREKEAPTGMSLKSLGDRFGG